MDGLLLNKQNNSIVKFLIANEVLLSNINSGLAPLNTENLFFDSSIFLSQIMIDINLDKELTYYNNKSLDIINKITYLSQRIRSSTFNHPYMETSKIDNEKCIK